MGTFYKTLCRVKARCCCAAGIVFCRKLVETVNDKAEGWFEEAVYFPLRQMHRDNEIDVQTRPIKSELESSSRLSGVLKRSLHTLTPGRSFDHLQVEAIGSGNTRNHLTKPFLKYRIQWQSRSGFAEKWLR